VKKFVVLSALAVAAAAGTTFGQGGIVDNTVGLTLQIVQVTGTNNTGTGYTRGTVGGVAGGPVAPGTTLLFEVQYTMSDTGNGTFPAGLVSGVLNITGSAGTYGFGALTKTQAGTGGAVPATADKSGPPTGALAGAAGLEKPYRGGFSTAGNNADPSNGTIGANGISSIVPLAISQTLANPLSGTGNGWYMLYMFSVTVPASGAQTPFTISADFAADPGTGSKFGFFDDGVATPDTSNNTTAGTVSFPVTVPAPASAALLGLGGLVAARRRRA